MLGGGVFVTQNKVLPGSYINFINASKATSNIGERGTVAIALSLGDLFSHVGCFPLIVVGLKAEEIRKKQPPKNQEKHHQFHRNNRPQRTPHSHTAETIAIE